MTRVLIMAGGTGGHVFPALAVAEELRTRSVDIEWIGTERGIESRLVPAAAFKLNLIPIKGLRGNGLFGWLVAPFRILRAVLESGKVIKRFQPDVVIGLGGFASGPGGLAAWLSGKPLIIHEQNAIAGLTNRLLAKIARQVLQGFENSFTQTVKTRWVGNPVRKQIEQLAEPQVRYAARTKQSTKVLVLGGSLGAKSLNQVVPRALAMLKTKHVIEVTHQCGDSHFTDCQQAYEQAGVDGTVTKFIDDMAKAYGEADLVICRAGALTVAEVAAAGVAAILVPYPYAVDDHQTHNAQALKDAGAALLINDSDLNPEDLAASLLSLLDDRKQLENMAIQARKLAKPGTAMQIADICLEYAHG
ncbi:MULTISPECIES: undecaprenyldiphospho-muramoylpentapeptide beta-N-acetylglucosaminyltransferase [unclassified Methylophaga]|uniref:undecaprenyldiphospho-muramoylpentapeptide beta-N-acetylglucosaminyltransferase n=1 Tax=unclassified Methylophaga TaxID=2629249 RepID=UPI000C95DC2B|nr:MULTISPECIES: undecaprenyldiphospho-muramoylpentapeptide beta-N-acetylglucosaminyltransferase [unclassified Methylophaga]MBN47194.1 undecaprenyldiphospho-muramoylpentapeptide beta-N-acetylglucosaminyltransferase [Methylophaga sp.]|tara:strand:- start:16221 stop:17300 length:1080 start_codon:yes stop_codon:yes gene_type:complete